MATKAQFKEYFKSQKIPTEAQFGTFIDSTFLLLKNQVDETIKFGNGDESGKPHLRAYRHVRKKTKLFKVKTIELIIICF